MKSLLAGEMVSFVQTMAGLPRVLLVRVFARIPYRRLLSPPMAQCMRGHIKGFTAGRIMTGGD
jgi:hypothetical protein